MAHTTWLQNHSEIDDGLLVNIRDMIKENGQTCISIIVPTHRAGIDMHNDIINVKSALNAAKIATRYESRNFYIPIMDDLFRQIDFTKNKEGIGLFFSPHLKTIVRFPFPVKRKVVVNKFFHLHDMIYFKNYKTVFYLLDVSKQEAHLFRGILDHLEEIRDEHFPQRFNDEFEYSKPSQSDSYAGYAHTKSFEKDKSEMEHIRLEKNLQETDKALRSYLTVKDIPFIICGPERDISIFKSITHHSGNIIGTMSDNYRHAQLHDLEVLAWTQIRIFIDQQKLRLFDEFKEKIGTGFAVYGMEAVRKAVKEGAGFKLLVEKDHGKSALITEPEEGFADTVNEIIAQAVEQNISVTIMETNTLKDFQRICLITKYKYGSQKE